MSDDILAILRHHCADIDDPEILVVKLKKAFQAPLQTEIYKLRDEMDSQTLVHAREMTDLRQAFERESRRVDMLLSALDKIQQ